MQIRLLDPSERLVRLYAYERDCENISSRTVTVILICVPWTIFTWFITQKKNDVFDHLVWYVCLEPRPRNMWLSMRIILDAEASKKVPFPLEKYVDSSTEYVHVNVFIPSVLREPEIEEETELFPCTVHSSKNRARSRFKNGEIDYFYCSEVFEKQAKFYKTMV